MLTSLHIRNFTAFEKADLEFSSGLNIIVGANGTGKSHLLKLGYAVSRASNRLGLESFSRLTGVKDLISKPNLPTEAERTLEQDANLPAEAMLEASVKAVLEIALTSKSDWQKSLADDLKATFRPDSLGRLTRRAPGRGRAEIRALFDERPKATIDFSFSTNSKSEVVLEGSTPAAYVVEAPVFIPTKELLSLFPGLRELYDKFHLALDVTYPDLCDRLRVPLLRGPKSATIISQLAALENLLGGSVRNENGRFYLHQRAGGRLEIDLVT